MLVPYDPGWPQQFREIAAELLQLGNSAWLIEHIGSTAVPGMMAKPIIDVAVRIQDESDFEAHRPGLEDGGWRLGSGVRTHHVMVCERSGVRTRIAHFFEQAAWETANQRILRDWLTAHPTDALQYQVAKIAAMEATHAGTVSYSAGKTTVIQEIVDRARAERGLMSVPVYEK